MLFSVLLSHCCVQFRGPLGVFVKVISAAVERFVASFANQSAASLFGSLLCALTLIQVMLRFYDFIMCRISAMMWPFFSVLRFLRSFWAFSMPLMAAWLSLHIETLLFVGAVDIAVAIAANSALVEEGDSVILPLKSVLGNSVMCHLNPILWFWSSEPSV